MGQMQDWLKPSAGNYLELLDQLCSTNKWVIPKEVIDGRVALGIGVHSLVKIVTI